MGSKILSFASLYHADCGCMCSNSANTGRYRIYYALFGERRYVSFGTSLQCNSIAPRSYRSNDFTKCRFAVRIRFFDFSVCTTLYIGAANCYIHRIGWTGSLFPCNFCGLLDTAQKELLRWNFNRSAICACEKKMAFRI